MDPPDDERAFLVQTMGQIDCSIDRVCAGEKPIWNETPAILHEVKVGRFSARARSSVRNLVGMGTSARTGLAALLEREPGLNAVLILVCDQPFVSTSLIDRLVIAYQSKCHQIVATSYLDTVGVLALFSDRYFAELLNLKSDAGARRIIQQHLIETYTIDFPQGAIDLDTPDEYRAFLDLSSAIDPITRKSGGADLGYDFPREIV